MAARRVAIVLVMTLAVNLAVAGTRFFLSAQTGSAGILADAFHAISDSGANIVALGALWFAVKPPDAAHPYGHRRFETAAVLVIGFFIALTALETAREAADRLVSRAYPDFSWTALAILSGTIAASATVAISERWFGRRYRSELLLADSRHTTADLFATFAVVVGFGAVAFGAPLLDPIAALVIAALIARTGIILIWMNIQVLVNSAAFTETEVMREVLAVSGVADCHRIRTFGPRNEAHMDLHVRVHPDVPHENEEALLAEVTRTLRRAFAADVNVVLEHQLCPDVS
ncbi:MAG: hypothetical protein A2991_03155 [Candidatus Terrybacteria bacterium RIFCSPLOWO2_01_FULL_58_14]|uniref:Cation efflux protein cytoplasmic domain-containing protein n=2 Tax=Candidatus Terryibacteriota TaxID=1817920 RepID=A0A1G2PVR9_9BACT|nr:MAG: hypothetical protein A2682_02810 [Candidatus Terrybacteria bacterium RIFCSPHIGHO2_01_FULL_58_15]OHA52393.1 MAG: hypothetical protein A2991_03155 [Candidatus Terrybacteria bacterium RIFCSPLOWO2_01_FULL_58_14]